jgi:hypothetical protein
MKLPERIARPEFWTAAFTGVLAMATLWAIWYARGQLREAHEEAQVQHLLVFIQQFEQEPMATYRRQLAEKRLKNEDEPDELWDELNFFDTIGLLVDRGYLNETDVWDSFSYWVFDLNADARDAIEREQRSDPNSFTNFTLLVDRLQHIETEHHGTTARPTKEEVLDFYRGEATVGLGTPLGLHPHSRNQTRKR